MSEPRLVCIIPGPSEVMATKDAGVKWCFGCRKHLPHEWRLMGDPFPSYYDPIWICKCSKCNKDQTRFPGTDW